MLSLARLAVFFSLLVLELAIVQQAAHGRVRGRRHLHEVEVGVAGDLQGLVKWQDSEALAVSPDYEDFPCPNPLVDAEFSSYSKLPLIMTTFR